jgi:hypothetical protein
LTADYWDYFFDEQDKWFLLLVFLLALSFPLFALLQKEPKKSRAHAPGP